ncbi:MAG: restriction endonuclease subunit S [Bacteroidales bacterium]|nr:restriction endonuclease subunit S [Bacteroidales bacterium]
MSNSYVKTPTAISFSHIVEKDFTLSSSQYMDLVLPNENFLFVRDFLSRPLQRKDLGVEVGSLNYIEKSTHYFLRTKALQQHTFLPEVTSETVLPIMPNSFVKMNLKKGDLIISKDSNIGEIVILDKDYPNYMLSGALYKLPVSEKKYYLFAFVKHNIFREQLDFMVPKGATIRHAKTLFLDCKIPLPNHNIENTIKFVELLTQAIINKEQLIKERHKNILNFIEQELLSNQKQNQFTFELPTIKEIEKVGRLDTGMYCFDYKQLNYKIKNYLNGSTQITNLNSGKVSITRGQNLQESNIGKSIYSDKPIKNFYRLCLSKHFNHYSTVEKFTYIGNPLKLKEIKKGEIIFSCRGDMGRSIIFCEDVTNTITNIDNVHIEFDGQELYKSIFISQFLTYLKLKNYITKIAITGSGADSFTIYQFEFLDIPNFPEAKQKEIALLYHNPKSIYQTNTFTLENFLEQDNAFNETAGIYELDKTAKLLKEILNKAIDDIANDREVNINFNL